MGRGSQSAVAMSDPKVVYTGAEVLPGRLRHHAYHTCLNLTLRLLTAAATLSAIVVILKSNQTVITISGYATARWRDFPAFRWLLIANAVVFVYSLLATLVACVAVVARRGPLSYSPSAWLTFIVDFLMASALFSAASAALAVAWIGKHGVPSASWPTTCGVVSKFCDYIQGAIIATFGGWLFLALSTLLAVSALHHLFWRRL